jgi:hypothetical protein
MRCHPRCKPHLSGTRGSEQQPVAGEPSVQFRGRCRDRLEPDSWFRRILHKSLEAGVSCQVPLLMRPAKVQNRLAPIPRQNSIHGAASSAPYASRSPTTSLSHGSRRECPFSQRSTTFGEMRRFTGNPRRCLRVAFRRCSVLECKIRGCSLVLTHHCHLMPCR